MLFNYTERELDLLARIMRSEAIGEGMMGQLMVGNVIANRVLANCLTFKNVNTLYDAIYQPNQFVGTTSSLFQAAATTKEKELAKRITRGEYYHPATNALWFYAPPKNTNCKQTWYDQDIAGRYKNHCFYNPDPGVCQKIH